MRRIGQIEAKSKGTFICSFESAQDFRKSSERLDQMAASKQRECAYIVVPFRGKEAISIQVFLMPEGYETKDRGRKQEDG